MTNFENFLKTSLNKPQLDAVKKEGGATLVVAGAGSGKTRVITARIANLILNQSVDPNSIIALTFTNKAASEMKTRITNFIGTISTLPFIGTFHSYCLLLLRFNSTLIPFSDFSIIDEDDQIALLKKLIKSNNLEKQVSVANLKHLISKSKNQLEPVEEVYENRIFKELFLAYETEKTKAHCLDFDDLLLMVLKLFQQNSSFKEKFQSRIKHLLVDEYQDTNGVQHELLKEMALNKKGKFILHSLCAVGDEDQSIYSWRGAKVTNILSFQKDFEPVEMIKIEQNYRSVQQILNAANSVIEHNKQRHPKKLWSEKRGSNRILSVNCQSGFQEAETISNYMKVLPSGTKLHDIAILYRTHFQSRAIEESLIRNSIPYKIIGGIRFYERKEIKDLLAYMRLVVNKFDKLSLFRIINTPSRGLGAKFEESLYNEWNKNPFFDFTQVLKLFIEKKSTSIKKFLDMYEKLNPSDKPSVIIRKILEDTEYFSYLRDSYDPHDADTKVENVQEFIRSIESFEKRDIPTQETSLIETSFVETSLLEKFLYEVALLQEKLEKNIDNVDQVQMMTLHAAKGLEFNTVIIAGLEEGLLPSLKSLRDDDAVEEERRLFYVGITRAMNRLILSRAMYRNTYGQVSDQSVSRFLTEIPDKFLHQLDISNEHPAKIKTLLSQWLGPTHNTFVSSPIQYETKTLSAPSQTNRFQKPQKKIAPAKQIITKFKSPWKNNQVVLHKTFGPGIIKKVEEASSGDFYLTIMFKNCEKRILSTFVKSI